MFRELASHVSDVAGRRRCGGPIVSEGSVASVGLASDDRHCPLRNTGYVQPVLADDSAKKEEKAIAQKRLWVFPVKPSSDSEVCTSADEGESQKSEGVCSP